MIASLVPPAALRIPFVQSRTTGVVHRTAMLDSKARHQIEDGVGPTLNDYLPVKIPDERGHLCRACFPEALA